MTAEAFVRQTIMLLHQLERFVINHIKNNTGIAKTREVGNQWVVMHMEDHMSFRYGTVSERLEFFVNPIQIHKIMDVELNPIKYYHGHEIIEQVLKLATIGAFNPMIIEKYMMENS